MAYLEMSKGNIYYEIHGEGDQTLIFLNGIMMNTVGWHPFVDFFKMRYKFVLVDFFDQGRSTYLEGENYSQSVQVEVVKNLIEHLALKNVILMGISYGGEVAMQFAVKYQHMIDRLILANTTAYTNIQLKITGESWMHAAKSYDSKIFFKATIPSVYSNQFYETHTEWLEVQEALFKKALSKKWYEGFVRLVKSAETLNCVSDLKAIKCPVLIIGSDQDLITPEYCQKQLMAEIPHADYVVIKDCGHASMYEKPRSFAAIVDGFAMLGDVAFNVL